MKAQTSPLLRNFKFLLFFLFLSNTVLSQEKSFKLYAVQPIERDQKITESYTNGDSLSTDFFKHSALSLLLNGIDVWKKQGDMYLSYYEIVMYNKGKAIPNKTPNSWAGTIYRMADMPDKIVIDKIKGGILVDGKRVETDIPSVTFYRSKTNKSNSKR